MSCICPGRTEFSPLAAGMLGHHDDHPFVFAPARLDFGEVDPAVSEIQSDETATLSEDQLAVAEYFGSDRYRQRSVVTKEVRLPQKPGAFEDQASQIPSGFPSLLSGLLGLAGITLLFGVAFPLEIELLNKLDIGRPSYVPMMIMVQTVFFPPVISFSFAAVAPMFWYGSIVLRFAMATAAVLPGCIGFTVMMSLIEGGPPDEFWHGFMMVMFTCLMSIATVALTVQMWSRWTLSHARQPYTALPTLGIGSLIQLTAIAAVGCAVFVSNDFGDYLEAMLLFAGVGSLAAGAIISTLIAYFRAGDRNLVAAVVGFVFALGAAFVMNGFFAAQEYGSNVISVEAILIGFTSIYGAALICGVMWLCLRWLRFCGWRCVNRKQEQTLRCEN